MQASFWAGRSAISPMRAAQATHTASAESALACSLRPGKRAALLGACILLASCGGGGGAAGGNTVPPVSAPSPTPALAADDWTTYAHDYERTGFEQKPNAISLANVAQLRLAWRITPDPACARTAMANVVFADQASPLVANGLV